MPRARTFLLLLALLGCSGCSAVIVPPAPSAIGSDWVPVLVTDYGYHSTIILPKSDGGLVEYAYGDWYYFGQSHKSLGSALHALFASDQATLGRRVLEREINQPGLKEAIGAETVLSFRARRDKVEQLERALEQRFSQNLDSIMYSPVHQLYFVKDSEPYGVGHNCNHFTAQWLERLGCRIEGSPVTSKFKLKEFGGEPGAAASPAAVAVKSATRDGGAASGNAIPPSSPQTANNRIKRLAE
jgi:hypothetical protein